MNERIDKRKSLIKAISAIDRYSQTYIGRNVKDYNIGQGQWAFLTQLLFNYDGITQEELSELLNIDKANTARALKKLEEEGYVYREEDPKDGRKKIVYVTAKARDFEQEFHEVFKGLNRILAKDFTEDERETARRILYKMLDNIADYERRHR
ncbi:MarR family transcriptional regulator [Desulfitobacterium sp. LBE]|uniref:HTH marR-type domain-containing protein n=5 Tax=root TaxID=1 RepID=Q252B8_DESHY|nr:MULTISPECIES: MarR family transcriptional regulator [Desulfitobacterium]ACL18092.1 transcriptional regulator, TrmB [Desulfitobacterium hafniense DCB-2]EHL05285.1 transcriptional regulator, MarR family [Desulfitobacterium hafniense DP7]KTE93246.1 MarR family transcriptional regulator [Desulfitobacterium hafniense]MEA5022734.1 MarR family transcriptional regulator [Desulfitobacterium hafniense]TWH58991.1 MarR family transcriptional regulator [Desulfitobacterium sp. LBE]